MRHVDSRALLDEIHKNKYFRPTEWEREFLENLSFYVSLGSDKITAKQSKILQEIYRKSQEVL